MLSAYRIQVREHTHTPDFILQTRQSAPTVREERDGPNSGMLNTTSTGSCDPGSVSGKMGGRREVDEYGEGGCGGGGGGGG